MGRHKEEIGTPIGVRIRSAELAELDAWCAKEGLTRQNAIRKLIETGIHGDTKIHGNIKPPVEAPAQSSPLDKLSPVARAAFDRLRPTLKGATDGEKIADLMERALQAALNNHAKAVAKTVETTAPKPSPEELAALEVELRAEEAKQTMPASAPYRPTPGFAMSDAQFDQELERFIDEVKSGALDDSPVIE